jgi:phosphohistidine phosphatase
MLLYITRHAWAYEHGDPRWPDDSQRPLEEEGVARFTRVVQMLAQRDFAPKIVATSPYVRCRQTAEIVAAHTAHTPEVVELEALEPGNDIDALVKWTAESGRDSVCWVGHSPDVERLTALLLGDKTASVRFAKGATAAIAFDDEVGRGAGELQWLATAKLLGV